MADFDVDIKGAEQIVANMRTLSAELRQKPGRSALGRAAKLIRLQAADNALGVDDPETGRRIADNIVQRWRSKYHKRTGDMMISIGVATERGRIPSGNPDTGPKGNTPHWHLLELGTEHMAPQPFLVPAAAQQGRAAVNEFARSLEKSIARILKKRVRK